MPSAWQILKLKVLFWLYTIIMIVIPDILQMTVADLQEYIKTTYPDGDFVIMINAHDVALCSPINRDYD